MRFLHMFFISMLMFFLSCSVNEQVKYNDPVNAPFQTEPGKTDREYNLKFIGFDTNIDDPAWDRRSYYKLYIDKVEAGRTTIGLESQKKEFEIKLTANNRHLLMVEKWVLDEKKGQYVKLNNIEQPKPDYVYFDIPDSGVVVITMKHDPFRNNSEYDIGTD